MTSTLLPPEERVERLSTASTRRVLEPEELFDWDSLGDGQIIPDELLSVDGLGLELTAEQKARLSREEVAAMLGTGIRFEAALMAGFGLQITEAEDLADPRIIYMLHEMGEETRHSRAFARLIEKLQPAADDPLRKGVIGWGTDKIMRLTIGSPSVLYTFVLAGEEIPDLLQKRASEHPDTDPLLAAVNRYHRQEEARHLAFARLHLPELWERAGKVERWRVLHGAPAGISQLFAAFVHPGVYATVGLPAMRTWRAVNKLPQRRALRYEATRGVLDALIEGGIIKRGEVPKGWQKLCGVDAHGYPRSDAPELAPLSKTLPPRKVVASAS
jgi:hypothetical protein